MKWIIVMVASVSCLTVHAQNVTGSSKSIRANNILNRVSQGPMGSSDFMVIGPAQGQVSSEIIGDAYFDPHWGVSSVELANDNGRLFEGYLTRYNVRLDEFEFRMGKDIRVLDGKKVKSVVWVDSLTQLSRMMVSARSYTKDNVPLAGFFEILSDGPHFLFKDITIEILKPNFNPALNVGSHDTRIVKHTVFYYSIDQEVKEIKSKKSIAPLIAKYPAIDQYIKQENIKFNNEGSLQKLFSYIASIATTSD